MQAAILRVKLHYLEQENARRCQLARLYARLLSATPLQLPHLGNEVEHVYHLYVVRTRQRETLRSFLREQGVATAIHYPVPVHLQPAYQGRTPLGGGGLPATERACQEILSLPMHPQLSDEQVRYVGDRIASWAEQACNP